MTDREKIALTLLQGKTDLLHKDEDRQAELIVDALSFADYFLEISRLETETVEDIEKES